MAENVLKARITADVSGLKAGLAQAERALDVYSQKIERVQEGIKRSDQQTKLFEVELNKLTSALKSGAINQDEFNKSSDVVKDNISKSRQETAAWQRELSRLEKALQDVKSTEDQVSVSTANVGQEIKTSQQGMRSANSAAINLTRSLTTTNLSAEGLGRSLVAIGRDLSRTSVSFGGFGKSAVAVLTSLITPANLVVLGITAVTAAFSLYRKNAEQVAEANRKSKESFDALASKIDESANSVSGEIAKIGALKSVIEDETVSRDKRLAAIDRLQGQYPGFFAKLTKEQLLNGEVTASYETLTAAILQRAKAGEAETRIVEIDKENQIIKNSIALKQEQIEKEKQFQSESSKSFDVGRGVIVTNQLYEKSVQNVSLLQKEIAELTNQQEGLGKESETAVKSIIDFQKEFASSFESSKKSLNESKVSIKEIFSLRADDFVGQLELINKALRQGVITPEEAQNIKDIIADSLDMANNEKLEQRIQESLEKSIKGAISGLEGQEIEIKDIKIDLPEIQLDGLDISEGSIKALKAKIEELTKLRDVTDPGNIAKYNLELKNLQTELNALTSIESGVVTTNIESISQAFSGMAFQISSALNISDRGLKSFVSTMISSTPKIIGALMAKAQASKASAAVTTSANLKEATGDAIVTGGKAAKALGPLGLAVLPVFIAGAVALISKAFSGSGGGGGGAMPSGGGGGASGGSGQTFTNVPGREFGGPVQQGRAYIVGERRPELFIPSSNGIIVPQVPNITNNMMSNAAQNMQVDVNITGVAFGEDILFTVEQASIKRGLR
jgi:hypothetical protein